MQFLISAVDANAAATSAPPPSSGSSATRHCTADPNDMHDEEQLRFVALHEGMPQIGFRGLLGGRWGASPAANTQVPFHFHLCHRKSRCFRLYHQYLQRAHVRRRRSVWLHMQNLQSLPLRVRLRLWLRLPVRMLCSVSTQLLAHGWSHVDGSVVRFIPKCVRHRLGGHVYGRKPAHCVPE